MTSNDSASIHASAVVSADRIVLIRGPSGSGKSRLAFALILAGRAGVIPPTTLVGDDRIILSAKNGVLHARGVPELNGKIEIYGLGIRHCESTNVGSVALVVDLDASDAERLPPPKALKTSVEGVELPRIPVAKGHDPLPLVVAFLTTT
ncbi:MAG: serine kinase [Afipia sp.]|nr:serine kinase [Afipia sp.]